MDNAKLSRLADSVGTLSKRFDSMVQKRRADTSGYVVKKIGRYKIIEGIGPDGGDWIAEGRGESKRFKSRKEAEDHAYASDPGTRDDSAKVDAADYRVVKTVGKYKVVQSGKSFYVTDASSQTSRFSPDYSSEEKAVQHAKDLVSGKRDPTD